MPYAFCEQIGKEIRDISDEIPFEIPDSWEWCRIGSIFTLQAGKNISANQIAENIAEGLYPCFGGNGIRGYVPSFNREGYYPIIGRQGALCGNINLANGQFYATEHAVCVETFANTDVLWCCYFLTALNLNQYATATAQPGLAVANINEVLIPLPPISEQHRIVAKIEELLPYIERYGKAEEHLTALNTTFPEALKKSILQEAVQGKLVPQNPDDEPASVLLERIRAEKQALIKAGKIKRDKHESVIVTRDKIPYEIPDNWEWCTLNDVVIQVADIDHKMPPTVEGEGFPYISPLDFTENGIDFSGAKKIGKEDFDKLATKIKPKRNDIIFPRYGTIGVIRLVETDIDFLVSYSCCTIKNTENMDFRYIYHVLKSPLIKDEINKYINKTTQPNVGLKSIKSFLFPLPPLAEQKRIAEKIEELMQYCDKLY